MNENQRIPPSWRGWYFDGDRLCTPEGDKFTERCVRACHWLRQLPGFSQVFEPASQRHELH